MSRAFHCRGASSAVTARNEAPPPVMRRQLRNEELGGKRLVLTTLPGEWGRSPPSPLRRWPTVGHIRPRRNAPDGAGSAYSVEELGTPRGSRIFGTAYSAFHD